MQVDCSVFPSGTAQLHESQLQHSSPVRCSAVQSSPGSPAHWSTVQCISIWSAMSSTMQSCWEKWSTTKGSAMPSIRVNCLSEKATFKSKLVKCSLVQSSPVTLPQWNICKYCGGEVFLNKSFIKVYLITKNTPKNWWIQTRNKEME